MSNSHLRLNSYSGAKLESPQHGLWVEEYSKLYSSHFSHIASVVFCVSKCDRCFARNGPTAADISCCVLFAQENAFWVISFLMPP